VSPRGAVVCGVVALLSGCVYYNSIYNAERLLREGEALQRTGRDSLATVRFREVVRKASGGYREAPEGEWAGQALLLIGTAHLRLGELRAARAALEEVPARAGSGSEIALRAELFLGAALVESGDLAAALPLLDRAVEGLDDRGALAEAHLWRGRARLREADGLRGWRDLEEALALDPAVALSAEVETIRSGIALGEPLRVRRGVSGLLARPDGGDVVDTLTAMVARASARWGGDFAVELLSDLDSASWAPGPRSRIRLTRSELFLAAGDTASADADLRRVASGRGTAAATARVRLARRQLAGAADLEDARSALSVLLPASGTGDAATLIADVQEVQELAERGLDDPMGWFAAAETARDRLGSEPLARGFFLAYADAVPADPWVPKALLAAMGLTDDADARAWLHGRLEGRATSPYVLAARGDPAPGLEELEEELARRLQEVRAH
jgi:tetratricopeptide (TPR) repeat protein